MPNLSVTKGSITWSFSQPVEAGQFANGDWWVVGPVTITAISPQTNGGLHGSMLNPPGHMSSQALDQRLSFRVPYSQSLNVAENLPLTINEGSLVSSESITNGFGTSHDTTRPQQVQVLTVLSSAPAPDALRPAYCGSDKTIPGHVSDIDFGKLANLTKPSNAPVNLQELIRALDYPWLDNRAGWTGRYIHPKDNMPDYGRDLCSRMGEAAIAVHMDYDEEEKRQLAIRLIQLGIDLYGITRNGGINNWYADGGHASGRKWPIVFAGLMLNRSELQNTGGAFGELQQTFYVRHSDVERPRSGVPYLLDDIGLPEWGIRHITHPHLDNKSWEGATYRLCCTANAWVGQTLATLIMDAEEIWGHQAYFDYMDRYMVETIIRGNAGWTRSWSSFAGSAWDMHRATYQLDPIGVLAVGESSSPNIRLDVVTSPIAGGKLVLEISGSPLQECRLLIGQIAQDPIRAFGATSHIDVHSPTIDLTIETPIGQVTTFEIDVPPVMNLGGSVGVQAFWLGNNAIHNSRAYEITIS